MKHRSVVANFIFSQKAEHGVQVALFRRSHHPNVHTYQGKLAPISGSIDANDADPLAAAVRELEEETKLVARVDLELQFCGQTFTFVDEAAQRSWTVHPFSWILTSDEEKIRLDWEHSGWEWTRPMDIILGDITYDCVPKLDWSFRRVYFGPGGIFGDHPILTSKNDAGMAFLSGLERLRTDKENGARVLATEAVKCLARIAKEAESLDWKSVRIAAYHLIYSARPSMNAAISSAVLAALKRIKPSMMFPPNNVELVNSLETAYIERKNTLENMANHFLTFAPKITTTGKSIDLLTLSSSSTVRNCILHLLRYCPDHQINVTILESRPLCEGVVMAADIRQAAQDMLRSQEIVLHIVPDFHIAKVAEKLHDHSYLLLGADRISPSGHVSNKMGSYTAAIVVKHLSPRTNVVILSETDKIAKPTSLAVYEKREEDPGKEMQEHSPESSDVAEVTRVWAAAGITRDVVEGLAPSNDMCLPVNIQNVYFEWVHRDLIDTYITEEGQLTRDRIRAISLEKARLEIEMFEDLCDH